MKFCCKNFIVPLQTRESHASMEQRGRCAVRGCSEEHSAKEHRGCLLEQAPVSSILESTYIFQIPNPLCHCQYRNRQYDEVTTTIRVRQRVCTSIDHIVHMFNKLSPDNLIFTRDVISGQRYAKTGDAIRWSIRKHQCGYFGECYIM